MKQSREELEILEKLGLNEKEARIYCALVELGEATASDIALHADINRTTSYPILDQLHDRGYIYKTQRGHNTYFIAERPMNLLQTFEEHVSAFKEYAQTLEKLFHTKEGHPRITFFDGSEGFRRVWRMIFESKISEYLIITDPREMLVFVQRQYITNRLIEEKKRLKIKSRQLIASSHYAREITAKDPEQNRTSKIIPHTFPIHMTTVIFGDNVALISPATENTILIIESKSFAENQRTLFELVWQSIPKTE